MTQVLCVLCENISISASNTYACDSVSLSHSDQPIWQKVALVMLSNVKSDYHGY
jgi:hypothetical protein